jgi:hypothetical protein
MWDLYENTKQQEGHIDIIFEPRFANQYVHFDIHYFVNSFLVLTERGGSGWGQNGYYSLDRKEAISYILSDDKKQFRKLSNFDKPIKKESFSGSILISDPVPRSDKIIHARLTCNESEINLDKETPYFFINKVSVLNPPFLCPKTGVIWDYRDQSARDCVYSDKRWLFKQLPKTRVIPKETGGLEIKRKVQITTLREENGIYDEELFISPTKTSFLSGKETILKRLGRSHFDIFRSRWQSIPNDITDSRDFLLKQPKTPKFAVIKCAARYLRKRLRISPLRPSEKKFFQMLGALAHINNETLNRKKVYAA